MKKLLEENETLTQFVYDARRPPAQKEIHRIYKPKFSSKNPAKNGLKHCLKALDMIPIGVEIPFGQLLNLHFLVGKGSLWLLLNNWHDAETSSFKYA